MTDPHLGGSAGVCHIDQGAASLVTAVLDIDSVVDIGAGEAGMAKCFKAPIRYLSVDGDPEVHPDVLHDFTRGTLVLDKQFDLAWSTEFLEHVEERFQANYMAAFACCRFAAVTAAPPGYAGHHHVNCRDAFYWTCVFRDYGFELDEVMTRSIRAASTMERDFMRDCGLFFRKP